MLESKEAFYLHGSQPVSVTMEDLRRAQIGAEWKAANLRGEGGDRARLNDRVITEKGTILARVSIFRDNDTDRIEDWIKEEAVFILE